MQRALPTRGGDFDTPCSTSSGGCNNNELNEGTAASTGSSSSSYHADPIDAEWAALAKPAIRQTAAACDCCCTSSTCTCCCSTSSTNTSHNCSSSTSSSVNSRSECCTRDSAPASASCCSVAPPAAVWTPSADAPGPLLGLKEVFVILFGTDGSAESQGIYSLRTPGPEGLPCETIVAFESRTDALRYCALVEATMERSLCPSVAGLPPPELDAFCRDQGYSCRLELAGSLLMPPETRVVGLTEWERALRLRQGTGFQVLDSEPQLPTSFSHPPPSSALPSAADAGQCAPQPQQQTEGQVVSRTVGAEFTRDQLSEIVAALEALLPSNGQQQ